MKSNFANLLRNRNFVLLWCAYGISAVGDHLSEMAILASQNALDPAIDITPLQARMTFLFMLPFFLFGPLAGAIADRFSRRRVMILADLVRVAAMFLFLTLINQCSRAFGPQWGPFVPLGVVGLFAALFAPAREAMVPTLVRSGELMSANAMIGGLGLIATMCSALVSGSLAEHGYIREAFVLDAASFAGSALCLFFIVPPMAAVRVTERRTKSTRNHGLASPDRATRVAPTHAKAMRTGVGEGFRYILNHRRVLQLIGIAVVFWIAGASVRSVIPAIVKTVYLGGFVGMARFSAWLGLGIVSGSAIILLLGTAIRSELAITWCLIGTGLSVAGLAASAALPFSPSTAHGLGVAFAILCGASGAGITVSYSSLLQRIVPDRIRGRVFGVLNLATVGGLLLATGTLAIPTWTRLDRWAPWVLSGVSILLCTVGLWTLLVRMSRTKLSKPFTLYRNIVEFIARFWYRLDPVGRCTIPREGPVIITANHECVIDPLLIYSCCRYRMPSFMIAAEYYDLPIFGHFIKVARCIPVRRGENDIRATKEAINRLRNGMALGIFIQGGIRNREEADQLKNGVALLALRTGATVVPVHLSGTRHGDKLIRPMFARHRARVAFGPPVDLSEFADGKGREALDKATQRIYSAIQSLAPSP